MTSVLEKVRDMTGVSISTLTALFNETDIDEDGDGYRRRAISNFINACHPKAGAGKAPPPPPHHHYHYRILPMQSPLISHAYCR
jgi:hypothetical protein